MTCRELTDFLADYIGGELPPVQRAAFEEHLAICQACRHYLASYRATIGMGKAALRSDESAVPDEVPGELVKAILAAQRRS